MVQSLPLGVTAEYGRLPRSQCQLGGHMNRVGFTEFLLILAIVVVIFGANRLPELGRGIGRGIRSFKESLREGANDKS